jgi:hypothetical protein
MLRGLDDYMILDEQTFRIGIDQGTLLVFLLVLNHGEETWDYPKGEVLKKRRILKHNFGEE